MTGILSGILFVPGNYRRYNFYRSSEARPPPNHLGLDFVYICMYVYVLTVLNSMHALVFCDRNSSAKKRKK